ncbi:MAG: DUF4058 family protein [Leptolyngbya sp. SIO3F4]|nr:DUF4058 family protein [Leptolyngbya sp. SIO3F4]
MPLQEIESDLIVDLQNLQGDIYDQSGYDLVIDYGEIPISALNEADSTWLSEWLSKICAESERWHPASSGCKHIVQMDCYCKLCGLLMLIS